MRVQGLEFRGLGLGFTGPGRESGGGRADHALPAEAKSCETCSVLLFSLLLSSMFRTYFFLITLEHVPYFFLLELLSSLELSDEKVYEP